MSRYGAEHRAIRRALLRDAYGQPCPRCGELMLPGQRLDLGHDDERPGRYRGIEHASCNRSAGAVQTNRERAGALRAQRKGSRRMTMTVKACALAVEVSSDRQHTAIAAASWVDGESRPMLQLVAYLDGSTTGVDEVSRLRQEFPAGMLRAVVVDPISPAATLIQPMQDARVPELVEPSTRDASVAGGWFYDRYHTKQLWFPEPHPALTTAMREVDLRSLAGGQTLDRRNPLVAPAVAAMWATWALLDAPKPLQADMW